MGLRTKFNLAILVAFLIGAAGAYVVLERQFVANAREEVLQNARIMLSAANAVRGYTAREIAPRLAPLQTTQFIPATVPSFAAQTNFRSVQQEYRDYIYKEAALNPTNPADRATDWEADFINTFRNNAEMRELVGERETPTGRVLTMARPIQVRDAGCLTCHSTPDRAPAAMLASYGTANGFGWQMNEIIGAQIVSVPMELALRHAHEHLVSVMGVLLGIFAAALLVLNLLLHAIVIRPVMRMARIAGDVSLGKSDAEEFDDGGKDEISQLGVAFNRMRRSLASALQLLDA